MTGVKKSAPKFKRNHELTPGVLRFSAARMFSKRYHKGENAKKEVSAVVKKIGGAKNGGERKVFVKKGPKLMNEDPALDVPTKLRRKPIISKLRKTITPGTVLIVLAGRHKGKRVVFLKQLEKSGLLLVTGPHKLNNVPVRRIAQAFVIATSTKIDISGVKLPANFNDAYFRRKSAKKPKKGEQANIFAAGHEEYKVTDQRKKDQKTVDKAVLDAIKKHPDGKILRGYFSSRFSVTKNALPHKLIF